jgi:hypothetical protein
MVKRGSFIKEINKRPYDYFTVIINRSMWIKLDKSILPIEITKRPDYIYKDKGWIN